MSDIAKRILNLKSKMEEEKISKVRAEEQLAISLKALEDSFHIFTLEEAEKELKNIEGALEKAQIHLNSMIEELEEKYDI